jgi:hypothetical protein
MSAAIDPLESAIQPLKYYIELSKETLEDTVVTETPSFPEGITPASLLSYTEGIDWRYKSKKVTDQHYGLGVFTHTLKQETNLAIIALRQYAI